jgi:hypothetical protein
MANLNHPYDHEFEDRCVAFRIAKKDLKWEKTKAYTLWGSAAGAIFAFQTMKDWQHFSLYANNGLKRAPNPSTEIVANQLRVHPEIKDGAKLQNLEHFAFNRGRFNAEGVCEVVNIGNTFHHTRFMIPQGLVRAGLAGFAVFTFLMIPETLHQLDQVRKERTKNNMLGYRK